MLFFFLYFISCDDGYQSCLDYLRFTKHVLILEVTCSQQEVRHVSSWDKYWQQTFKSGESTRYWCETGYRRKDGASSATCTRDGWHPNPLCQEYKEHQVLEFQCKPSFARAEARSSKCTKQGVRAEWSPTPLCEPITCKLQLPGLKGTSYEPAYRNTFSPGDEVTVNCGDKYWISRRSSVVTTCKEDAEWTIRPVCQANKKSHMCFGTIFSSKHSNRVSGHVTGVRQATGGKMAPAVATCTRDGWHPNPLCQAIACKLQLPGLKGTSYEPAYRNTFLPGDEVTVNCGDKYWISRDQQASVVTTCKEDGDSFGLWKTNTLADGDIEGTVGHEYRQGAKVKYICPNYYIMQGDPYKTCTNEPCTVNSQDLTTHNIDFRHSTNNKLYLEHDDIIGFRCTSGRHDGVLNMRQKCNDGLQIGLEAGTDLRKSLSNLFPCETLSSLPLSVYNSVSVSCFYFCLAVQGNEDKMHLITQSCVLFLWMHSLTFVKGQVGHKVLICISCPTECTLEQFLNGPLYDPNFDTSGLAATYSGGKQVRVGCNVGFSGFFQLQNHVVIPAIPRMQIFNWKRERILSLGHR
ncbi:hypothetical protein F7725_028017 [Dissostichus mawsoni]|uniref:Sushi domain-containing protein n=1 Tax=Dissostichus mawsoni TaxID=36200 RepID=A0A7J5XFJ7_DISMA|nr:hypothetical protein F7725_028017 [Dissostichus mawsoni]